MGEPMPSTNSGAHDGRAKTVPIHQPAADWRWDLVERVAASPAFGKANRLREFLLYVCRRSLDSPGAAVPEHEIGVAVFGRPADYDTNQDNLVRVQASQLRKKLARHFAGEGASEPWVIEIPRGSYTPVFSRRDAGRGAGEEAPVSAGRFRRLAILAGGGAVLFAGLFLWQTFRFEALKSRVAVAASSPSLDRLWRQLFSNGRPMTIVLADGNLAHLNDIFKYSLTLDDYRSSGYINRRIKATIADPGWRLLAGYLSQTYLAALADTRVAHIVERLNMLHGVPSHVTFARLINIEPLQTQNAVLLGNARGNPWVSLFEERLNFQYRFDDAARLSQFVNTAPRAGEAREYRGSWGREGYCRIAALPNLSGKGNVLIVSGTEMASAEAGGEIIGNEYWISKIARECPSGSPYFEAFFKTVVFANTSPKFELIAARCGGR